MPTSHSPTIAVQLPSTTDVSVTYVTALNDVTGDVNTLIETTRIEALICETREHQVCKGTGRSQEIRRDRKY